MTARQQNPGVEPMRQGKPVSNDRYLYISGRIKALELQLMDSARLARLMDARVIDDIGRVLNDSGYPAAADPETRLNLEMTAMFNLLRPLFPEPAYVDILLMFHDFHNLKVILKNLTPAWPRVVAAGDEPETASLPESAVPYSLSSGKDLKQYFLQPSLADPQVVFTAIRDRQPGLVPAWIYESAVEAVRGYQYSYDIGGIDVHLDKAAYKKAMEMAQSLGNKFFTGYLQLLIDQINLGLLLRTRYLRSGRDSLAQALLAGGTVAPGQIAELYPATADQIQVLYGTTSCARLADLAAEFSKPGSAGRFSRLADNLTIAYISQARQLWCGPEIPLAYMIARLMEIKNIRIALTCLRNGLPAGQAREMSRDSYLPWR